MADPTIGSQTAAAARSTYRSFLFADLRGYTATIERAGNAAGVALLDEYLAIVRAAVARHEGAEIKVEGDGFHAVFPSASSAVMCGLEICDAASQANEGRPDLPIKVGIGIHAGEALETPDGYIGSAVNIAARVCAAALSGEVLVTGTVRGITQASIPVVFTSRGRKRLKGIPEPIDVYAVTSEGVFPPRQPMNRRRLGAFAVIGAVVVGVVAILLLWGPLSGLLRPGTPLEPGLLQPGVHVADEFQIPFTFTVDNQDWVANDEQPALLALQYDGEAPGNLDVAIIEEVYTETCNEAEPRLSAGDTPSELISALVAAAAVPEGQVQQLAVSEPADVEVDGRPGMEVQVDVLAGGVAACGGAAEAFLFTVGGEPWKSETDRILRLISVDVDGTPVTFIQKPAGGADTAVAELDAFFAESRQVIDSVKF